MPVQVNFTLPEDMMDWLAAAAAQNYRTPEGQLLFVIRRAMASYAPPRTRPDSAGARAPLAQELQELHARNGLVSCRGIADQVRRNGGQVSHTTVNEVISGRTLPSWRVLLAIVTALDGDGEHFKRLWLAARGYLPDTEVS